MVDQLYGPFRGQFDYIVLICPTFAHNKTFQRVGENDPRMFVVICEQLEVESWLRVAMWVFEGANTLIILGGLERRERTYRRVCKPRFLGSPYRHQRLGANPKVYQHHCVVPGERGGGRSFLHPGSQGHDHEKHLRRFCRRAVRGGIKALIAQLKAQKYVHLVFSLRHPFAVTSQEPKKRARLQKS